MKETKYLKLRATRVLCGVKQEELAAALGVSLATYCHKEKGRYKFNLEEAYKITRILNDKLKENGYSEETIDSLFATK